MGLVRTTLELYKDITSGTSDSTKFHVPAVGDFTIVSVTGEAAFDLNCAVRVTFGGDTVWFTKGSSKHNDSIELVGDNVKKVELILDAVDLPSGSVFLGGHIKIEQET